MTKRITNFVDLLCWQAEEKPNQRTYTFLEDGETESATLTYTELHRQAQIIAFRLGETAKPGDRILLLYPPSLDYIAAFFGCLYGGFIAVPAYPPRHPRHMQRIEAILADAEATVALTLNQLIEKVENWLDRQKFNTLSIIATDLLTETGDRSSKFSITEDTLAFLQYTSGSTGNPKGVKVTHGNLWHNSQLIYDVSNHNSESILLSWLPPYHDMGLIAGILQSFYGKFPGILMSPATFMQRPYVWLQAISRYRATTSGGPNFAYDLCVDKVNAEQRQNLDLSCWRVASNGAEPIRFQTLERFAATFADCGFRADTFLPCYGLAEATLIVTGQRPYRCQTLNKDALERKQVVVVKPGENGRQFVSSGQVLGDMQVAIADPETLTASPRDRIGEIWIAGPSVTQGYWNQTEATAEAFTAKLDSQGSFLRTGDLGFILDGELYITGRIKDAIVIRGRNYYPQDIEQAAIESHEALSPNSAAAFSVTVDGEAQIIVVAEVKRTAIKHLDSEVVTANIRKSVVTVCEVPLHTIVLLKPGTIPKTSSGKIRRLACQNDFLAGNLTTVSIHTLTPDRGASQTSYEAMRSLALNLPPSEQPAFVKSYLKQRLARLLNTAAYQFDSEQPITYLGLDSILLLEFRVEIEQGLNQLLPDRWFTDDLTLSQLTTNLLQLLAQEPSVSQFSHSSLQMEACELPLLSYQREFLSQDLAHPEHFKNLILYLGVPRSAKLDLIEKALQQLLIAHDALQLRFINDSKQWRQYCGGIKTQVVCEYVDAVGLPMPQWRPFINRTIEELNQKFDLTQGPLLRATLIDFGSEHTRGLILAFHHLAVDGASCSILLSDFRRFYQQLSRGETPTAIAPAISWRTWVQSLEKLAQSKECQQQLPVWKKLVSSDFLAQMVKLQVEKSEQNLPEQSQQQWLCTRKNLLTPDQLQNLQIHLGTGILFEGVILTALTQAFCQETGESSVRVNYGRNGRNRLSNSLDPARTVGCFFHRFPLLLLWQPDLAENWRQICEQLQNLPYQGLDYGLLRYLCQDSHVTEIMEQIPEPLIYFQYMSSLSYHRQTQVTFPLVFSQLSSNEQNTSGLPSIIWMKMLRVDGSLWSEITYHSGLYSTTAIAQIEEHLTTTLQNFRVA
ncbi:MAG TPA: AMP-binding protein [Kamptonema sp.]|nr:AMP-binding protein [Kamptonema sp.]